jgi:hypothetical protein
MNNKKLSVINKDSVKIFTALLIILFAVFSRLMPHPPNFSPITAVALFSAVYLGKKFSMAIPIVAMVISDLFIGFHSLVPVVYGCFLIITLSGFYLKKHKTIKNIVIFTLSSSLFFFIVTNFFVWVQGYYGYTFNGLMECYVMAIPFFKNTLLGDFLYTGAMFGLYEFVIVLFGKRSEEKKVDLS